MFSSYANLVDRFPGLTNTSARLVCTSLKNSGTRIIARLKARYDLPVSSSVGSIAFTTNPVAGKVVVVGTSTYVRRHPRGSFDIKVGTDLAASLNALVAAVNEAGGGLYEADTTINVYAEASVTAGTVTFTARQVGTAGDGIALSTDVSGATVVAFAGGSGDYPQLVEIEEAIAATDLMFGAERSAFGTTTLEVMKNARASAFADFKEIASGAQPLANATGTVLAAKDGIAKFSTKGTPFADYSDPRKWVTDGERRPHSNCVTESRK